MAQRVGPVTIEDNNNEDDDLTVIQVPSEAVGFVTGSQGNFLRQVEEEWGTLMFFADFRGRGERVEVRNSPSAAQPASTTCRTRAAEREHEGNGGPCRPVHVHAPARVLALLLPPTACDCVTPPPEHHHAAHPYDDTMNHTRQPQVSLHT